MPLTHYGPRTCIEGVAYVWYHMDAIDTGQEGVLNIVKSESGLVYGLVLLALTLLFLLAAMVALLGHNLIVFVVLALIGVTVYPVTSSVKKKYAK